MKKVMTIVYLTTTSLLLTLACKSNPVAEGEMPVSEAPLSEAPLSESTDTMTATTSPEASLSPEESAPSSLPEEPTMASTSSLPDESSSASSSMPDEVTKVAGLGASSSGRSR